MWDLGRHERTIENIYHHLSLFFKTNSVSGPSQALPTPVAVAALYSAAGKPHRSDGSSIAVNTSQEHIDFLFDSWAVSFLQDAVFLCIFHVFSPSPPSPTRNHYSNILYVIIYNIWYYISIYICTIIYSIYHHRVDLKRTGCKAPLLPHGWSHSLPWKWKHHETTAEQAQIKNKRGSTRYRINRTYKEHTQNIQSLQLSTKTATFLTQLLKTALLQKRVWCYDAAAPWDSDLNEMQRLKG